MDTLTFPLSSAFLALPLENEAKLQFREIQEKLKEFEDCLRQQNPESPHLTLQFWKELMEIEYKPIIHHAQKIAATTSTFTLNVTEANTFSYKGEDKVLYLDIAFSEELARLKKSCPWVSEKIFRPHITLARIRHTQKFAVQKKKILKKLKHCSFKIPVDTLRLYCEIDCTKQTPIEDFALI